MISDPAVRKELAEKRALYQREMEKARAMTKQFMESALKLEGAIAAIDTLMQVEEECSDTPTDVPSAKSTGK